MAIDSTYVEQNLTDDSGDVSVVTLTVAGYANVSIQLDGTFAGTVQFEGTVNNDTWAALSVHPSDDPSTFVTSSTAAGLWLGDCGGLYAVRARCSTFTSGVIEASVSGAVGQSAQDQLLALLATGLLKVTTTTGILSSVTDSAGLAGCLSDETGSGAAVFADTPTLITPEIGAATGTSVNLSGDARAATFHVGATAGIDTTITTATLVGKTITVTKGLITGFA